MRTLNLHFYTNKDLKYSNVMRNDDRCIGQNRLETRRDAKIKALELISSVDYETLLFNDNNYSDGVEGVESDRDMEWLTEALNDEVFRIQERVRKLKGELF